MSSLGKIMNKELEPICLSMTAGEALALMEQTGLFSLPVIDKNHKLLGLIFKQKAQEVPPHTPLVKY